MAYDYDPTGQRTPRTTSPSTVNTTGRTTTTVAGTPDPNAPPSAPDGTVRDQRQWRADAGMYMDDESYNVWRQVRGFEGAGGYGGGAGYSATQAGPLASPMSSAGGGPGGGPGGASGDLSRADFGVPGADELTQLLRERAANVLGRSANDDLRARQMALADQFQRYASGQESLSRLDLQRAAEANMAQQMAMAAGARPGASQLAALTAAQQVGAINTGLAGQQAMAGLAERQQAANALGSLLGQTRGMDLSFSQQQDAAYQQALAQRLALAELQQRGTTGYANYLTTLADIEAKAKGQPATWERLLRGGTDLLGAYASMTKDDKSAPPYQSAQTAAMDMLFGGGS